VDRSLSDPTPDEDPFGSASDVTVGFAGLGRMGLPMARNLLSAGFPLLVWNRTADRCAPLIEQGATAASDPASLADADVVVTMLSDGAAVHAVLVESGLLEKLRPGSIVLEMSTIGPKAVSGFADEARRNDVHLLDAPVSGSVSVAEAAQLYAMVGGDRSAYDRVKPVLDAMTKGHTLLGPSGSGAAMKLAVNGMIAVTNESIAETLVLAERFGIERERAYDVLADGVLASPFLVYKRAAFLDPETAPVAFTSELMRKDISLAEGLAAELEVRLPTVAAAAKVLDEALRSGLGDADMASVIGVLGGRRQPTPTKMTEAG
jgi:3-hydroxyisobutyrate dehydrogenase-like beta-hydroxyacid dehydrogenase